MANKKIIVGGAAAVLAMAAIGTSYALYTVTPNDQEVNIGVRTDIDLGYEITDLVNDGEKLAPAKGETPKVNNDISFNIKGIKGEGTSYAQPYVLAKLNVTVTPSDPTLGNVLEVAGNIGYKDSTYYMLTNGNALTFEAGENGVIAAEWIGYIYVGGDEAVAPNETAGTDGKYNPVELDIALKDSVTATDFVTTYAEMTYTVDVTLGTLDADDEYGVAYLVGGMNGWAEDDAYEMVLNIEKGESQFEWMWLGTIETGTMLKGKNGNTWSTNDVAVPEGAKGFYWTGGGDADVTFDTTA